MVSQTINKTPSTSRHRRRRHKGTESTSELSHYLRRLEKSRIASNIVTIALTLVGIWIVYKLAPWFLEG